MRRPIVLAVVFLVGMVHTAGADEPVYFADAHLQAAVEEALWVSDPTPADMLGLTSLTAGSSGITDLTGLEYATNLYRLDLPHNEISSVSPLAGLENLETLALNTNQISDISPLSGLSNLESLNLHDNEISTISAVSGLEKLTTLILRINYVSDISAVAGLTRLETLRLDDNQISDISPLSGLSNLQHLRLGFNQIGSVSALSGLDNLTYLDLYGNNVGSVSPLSGLSGLETLILANNDISDISPLAGLMSLGRLDLRDNPLNQEACDVYLPQIAANNPGIYLKYDACGSASYRLRLSSTAGGSVTDPGEGEFTYNADELVRIEATADPGYVFSGFTGSYATSRNPSYITMDQDYDIQANFVNVLGTIYVDDDAPSDPGPGDPTVSDPQEDGTPQHPFDRIQEAIDVAADDASIIVSSGTYAENIRLRGKSVHLTGIDPNDSATTAYPVIRGADRGPVVRFTDGEGRDCLLIGFVITAGDGDPASAVHCNGSSPTITNCLIVGNRSTDLKAAAVYCTESQAAFINCTIADNSGGQHGAGVILLDSDVVIVNSIIWGNTPSQVLATGEKEPSITYTDVEGWWPDWGNLHDEPLFARRGHWAHADDPNIVLAPDAFDAVWVDGDYHLQSEAGRWGPQATAWIQDDATSPCVDAGDRTSAVGQEPVPNGDVVNMGAYGGTAQASRSRIGP